MLEETQIVNNPESELRKLLEKGETGDFAFSSPSLERLRIAIDSLNKGLPESPSQLDIAILVRQALRKSNDFYKVIRQSDWPTEEHWQLVGINSSPFSESTYSIKANPWFPEWLSSEETSPVDASAMKEEVKTNRKTADPDPFLRYFGRDSYKSSAQKIAVRSALLTKPGSTLAICLPTGEGKSFIFQVLSEFSFSESGSEPGTTLVICPTIALTLDQETSAKELMVNGSMKQPNHDLAYVGDMDENAKQAIRNRISGGTQGICITSPESVDMSLYNHLKSASRAGLLKTIVIDEAHLVDSWGSNFRSSFQMLSGSCREFASIAPKDKKPSVILLSATFTESSFEALRSLFPGYREDEIGDFDVVSGQYLRPEIEYWKSDFCQPETQIERVKEAVLNLPRPAILYVTEVKEAYEWSNRLKSMGFKRFRTVTGKGTSKKDTDEAVKLWRENKIDLVIGNLAFGLGIDNPNVRTIIHACVPETIDRFYQEVGRGGRDGRSSLSVLIPKNRDLKIARDLNRKRLLTIGKGYRRWESMFGHKDTSYDPDENTHRVRIDTAPLYKIDSYGAWNTEWNSRTLTLMANVGMIELLGKSDEDENFQDLQEQWNFLRYQKLRVLDDFHLEKDRWSDVVENHRTKANQMANTNLEKMTEYINGTRCVADIFSEIYSFESAEHNNISVSKSCAGCEYCRSTKTQVTATYLPLPTYAWGANTTVTTDSLQLLDSTNRLLVFYPKLEKMGRLDLRRWKNAVSRLAKGNFHNIILDNDFFFSAEELQDECNDWPLFLSNRFLATDLYKGPTIVFFSNVSNHYRPLFRKRTASEPHIIFLPDDTSDFDVPEVRLSTRFSGEKINLDVFINGVS